MASNIALIFDFDDTIVPDTTTELLVTHGINPTQFWQTDVKGLVTSGFDNSLAYLNELLKRVGTGKPLGNLTNKL